MLKDNGRSSLHNLAFRRNIICVLLSAIFSVAFALCASETAYAKSAQTNNADNTSNISVAAEDDNDNKDDKDESSFYIDFIDVGQGDCALVCCDGHYMMIDGGNSSMSSLIYSYLTRNSIDKLDFMIATHPDADHIGGLSGALQCASVDVCYSPVDNVSEKCFESLVKYLKAQNAKLVIPGEYLQFQLGSATVELIIPGQFQDDNNNSIITRISYGDNVFLFMGDAENKEEYQLIRKYPNLKCDVIKIGHHGSSSSSTYSLLYKCKPEAAVISVGKNNTYGHPTEKVLDRLLSFKTQIYRTDLQGDIRCVSDGKSVTFLVGRNVTASEEVTYILNVRSKKFHYPTCKSVSDMSEKNKLYSSQTREEIVAAGYSPCGNCRP